MTVKPLTRVTCTAGLLLVELAPTATAQPIDLPAESGPDSVPISAKQTAKTFAQVPISPNAPAFAAQPERLVSTETPTKSAAIAQSAEAVTRSPESVTIASPERLQAVELASFKTTSAKNISISTRARDLGSPASVAISQPETIREAGGRRQEAEGEEGGGDIPFGSTQVSQSVSGSTEASLNVRRGEQNSSTPQSLISNPQSLTTP
ncbi:MAG: hypothetical protein IGS48_05050, partial [Oscillatoriales cyanobacterium C42_A2020_001]|nr:hypothetical protein [Leptolyngbyaceae cyanobacterium C42_A2020_001]